MGQFTNSERQEAIVRGLEFIYRLARRPRHFAEYGSDLLSCFNFISLTSKEVEIRRLARKMGRERAGRWRELNTRLPAAADADTVIDLVHGTLAASGLGFSDKGFDRQLKDAIRSFKAIDFLSFDPATEPPPEDVPEQCECGLFNERGRKRCHECRRRLTMTSRYRIWYYALMRVYTGEKFGFPIGASYMDVLKWLQTLRPYHDEEGGANPDFYDTIYAITHVVYTLNDYNIYRLSPRWLPDEFAFLKANMKVAIETEDPETLGEFLDSLRAFGMEDEHPAIRRGIEYLLLTQNADGSWGEMMDENVYRRYHPTWTAIDGLREYRWRGRRLSFPELLPTLRAWARKSPGSSQRSRRLQHDESDVLENLEVMT